MSALASISATSLSLRVGHGIAASMSVSVVFEYAESLKEEEENAPHGMQIDKWVESCKHISLAA